MRFSDPLAFEEYLSPIGGDVRIRPLKGSRFGAKIDMRKLQRAGLFTVESDSFCAQKSPQEEFFGFTIPLNAPFSVAESGQTYGRHIAHLLSPGNPFTFKSEKNCHAMVCNIFSAPLNQYKERVLQDSSLITKSPNPTVSLVSAEGSWVFRSVTRAWIALGLDALSISAMSLREIEDDLLASFLLLVDNSHICKTKAHVSERLAIERTEEYISANLDESITRDDLADVASVSIRSLSRAFRSKYGLGPMAFVRQRRLDACYARLRGSDPLETTVTKVAMSYGFGHIGKFAIAYKQVFGESPSASLREK